MRIIVSALSILSAVNATASPGHLSMDDLQGRWRMSALSTAKYGCDIPGAVTVEFKSDGNGGWVGVYTVPSLPETYAQPFEPVASIQTVLTERRAGGRAITFDAPKALRRILAVETAKGTDGRPSQLEWASAFGGFGEEASLWDKFEPSAWLTRCP